MKKGKVKTYSDVLATRLVRALEKGLAQKSNH